MDRQSRPMAEWGIGKKCAFLLVFCCFPSLVFIFISRFSDFFFSHFRLISSVFVYIFSHLISCFSFCAIRPWCMLPQDQSKPQRRKKTIRQTPIKTLTRAQIFIVVCVSLLAALAPAPALPPAPPGAVSAWPSGECSSPTCRGYSFFNFSPSFGSCS